MFRCHYSSPSAFGEPPHVLPPLGLKGRLETLRFIEGVACWTGACAIQ